MEEPTSLYMCLTCGTWKTLTFFELVAVQIGCGLKPTCATCNQIMYNVKPDDKLELMEEPEPIPVEQLHPFDVRVILSDMACMDNPMLADIRNWITDDLQKSLIEVIWLDVSNSPVSTGIAPGGFRQFAPGSTITFTVRFKGEPGEHKKAFNRNDYVAQLS